MRNQRIRLFLLAFVASLALVSALQAQQSKAAGSIPAQIATSKKVFISNAGADTNATAVFKDIVDPHHLYDKFYTAMNQWGRYQLVAAPADADLVYELRFTTAVRPHSIPEYYPQLRLTVLDPKTHVTLWSLSVSIKQAYRQSTWIKNFDEGVTSLMDDLKKLVEQSAQAAAAGK